jgi:hypothetical protein
MAEPTSSNHPLIEYGREERRTDPRKGIAEAGERVLRRVLERRGYRGSEGEGWVARAAVMEETERPVFWSVDEDWVADLKRFLLVAGANDVKYVENGSNPVVEVWSLREPVFVETASGERFTPEVDREEGTDAAVKRIVREGVWRHEVHRSTFIPPHQITAVSIERWPDGSVPDA